MLNTILEPSTTPEKRSRKRTTYGTLGQFRVMTVQEGSPCLLCLNSPEMVAEAWRKQVATSPWFDPDKEHMVVFVPAAGRVAGKREPPPGEPGGGWLGFAEC